MYNADQGLADDDLPRPPFCTSPTLPIRAFLQAHEVRHAHHRLLSVPLAPDLDRFGDFLVHPSPASGVFLYERLPIHRRCPLRPRFLLVPRFHLYYAWPRSPSSESINFPPIITIVKANSFKYPLWCFRWVNPSWRRLIERIVPARQFLIGKLSSWCSRRRPANASIIWQWT